MCRHKGRPGKHAAAPPAPLLGREVLSRFFFCRGACRPQGVGGIYKAHLQPASKGLGTQPQHDDRRDREREERERQHTSLPHPFQTQHLAFAYQNAVNTLLWQHSPAALRWPSSPQQFCQGLSFLWHGIEPLPSPPSSLKVYPGCGTHKPPLGTAGCLQQQGLLKGLHELLLSVQIAQH